MSHVTAMHQNGGFRREFEALQEWEQRRKAVMEEAAEAAGHSPKKSDGATGENRYANVVACTYLGYPQKLIKLEIIPCEF